MADSIFIVTNMLAAAGEQVLAAKMRGEIIKMSRDMGETKDYLARRTLPNKRLSSLKGVPSSSKGRLE